MTDDRTKETRTSNREHKSDVFTALFSEPENAAKLYSALSGEEASPEDIKITTLEGVLFLARKNDLGFTVKDRILVISEHQSTVNENIPLRSLLYYGRTMEKLLEESNLYRERRIPIPTPEFFLFYNGSREVPEEKVLKLSDGYIAETEEPMLELKVRMININLPVGHKVLKECGPLYEYAWFIERVRVHLHDGMDRDAAVTLAVKDSVRKDIFSDFVKKHGTEVENMLYTQFNMDDALEVRYEEGLEEGERRLLIRLVCGKLQKGESPEKIAVDLLADRKEIDRICEAYTKYGPDETVLFDKLERTEE